MKSGHTYQPHVEDDEVAREVIHKISATSGMVYLNPLNMALDTTEVLIACPYDVIDRKQKEAQSG